MKIKNILLYLCAYIFCAPQSFAQSNCDCFDRLINLSNYYDAIGNDSMSISATRDAFSFLGPDLRPQFFDLLGGAYAYYKQFDSATKYYTIAVMQGGYDINIVKEKYPEVYQKMDTNKIKKVLTKTKEKIDLDLYSKFATTFAIDQSIRGGAVFPESYWQGKNTPLCLTNLIDSVSHNVDSVSFEFVKWVLDTYKFPDYNKLGFMPEGFVAMILHVTAYQNEKWDKYIYDKLTELHTSCNYVYKSQILFLKEREKLFNNLKTQVGGIGGKDRYANILYVNKADSIRLEYNMLRIKDEAKGFPGNTIPDGYKPIAYPKNFFCLKKYHLE